jgi:XTP/dITP diphosphohydrolase
MKRKFVERHAVIASHNLGKIDEIRELLIPYNITTISAKELNFPEPEETGQTFVENAEIKARAASTGSGLPALADDSGLVIPILGGDPGIFSARWALEPDGKSSNFTKAIRKIKHAIKKAGVAPEGQKASLVCALSLCWPDGIVVSFEGVIQGSLAFPPRGNKGFGYDPIFIPENRKLTFSEMDQIEKHQISHRSKAFKKFIEHCFN